MSAEKMPHIPFQGIEYGPDEDGFMLEDRPIGNGMIVSIRYRGFHLDSCIKTDDGWVCNDNCHVEERESINKRSKIVDTPIEFKTNINKSKWFKYEWNIKQVYETRKFTDGRSFRIAGQSITDVILDSGIVKTKLKAKKKIAEAITNHSLHG